MTYYRAWQTGKASTTEEISLAVQNFINKFGYPPSVLEVGQGLENVVLPEGLRVVVSAVRIPKNIMLAGGMKEEESYDGN